MEVSSAPEAMGAATMLSSRASFRLPVQRGLATQRASENLSDVRIRICKQGDESGVHPDINGYPIASDDLICRRLNELHEAPGMMGAPLDGGGDGLNTTNVVEPHPQIQCPSASGAVTHRPSELPLEAVTKRVSTIDKGARTIELDAPDIDVAGEMRRQLHSGAAHRAARTTDQDQVHTSHKRNTSDCPKNVNTHARL
jgi:hypothetical protein